MSDLRRAIAHLRKAESNSEEARILMNAKFPDGASNRAYYAMFDCIMALLHTTDGPIPKTRIQVRIPNFENRSSKQVFSPTHIAL
ncbi:HEPN domain-containing protein [Spirosoma soli]|uniref:HEPN domain-containing protein n=1 Tax=Spirosoma soli TaxID=1770529 RepID=A0ABW5M3S6_9BACT